MNEIWKDIEGYDGHYQVSNMGQVRVVSYKHMTAKNVYRTEPDRIKAITVNKTNGYCYVSIKYNGIKKTLSVHRLVANAFIDNPYDKSEVNHIDGDKCNNCTYNLEWVNPKDNMKHAANVLEHNFNRCAVIATDIHGNIIKEFKSLSDAYVFATGIDKRILGLKNPTSNITQALNNGTIAYGYYWDRI